MGRQKINYKYPKKEKDPPTAASSATTLLFEKRVLTFFTCLLFVGLTSWLAAISTDYWIIVVGGFNGTVIGDKLYLWSHSGLWRRCDIYAVLSSPQVHNTRCTYHSYSEDNLVRLELAFVVIVLILLSLACGFSIYSLCHPRYTYKRVAGGLHLFSAILILALNQIVESEGHLSAAKLQEEAPGSSNRLFYGYSHLMAWIAFV